jgi:hypothetical protein
LIVVVVLAGLALLATWLCPRIPKPSPEAAEKPRSSTAPSDVPSSEGPDPSRADSWASGPGSPAADALAARLAREPLSSVEHRVLRAWGGMPGEHVGKTVGVVAVVDSHLPTAALERLARDIRERYAGAAILAVRIFDSEEAASYPQHVEGGALARRHLVADVTRNATLEVDTLRIRGIPVDP